MYIIEYYHDRVVVKYGDMKITYHISYQRLSLIDLIADFDKTLKMIADKGKCRLEENK